MLDRQDIDALLVGALYGELSPAENTRLEAHLTAHPQDKLVLDGLTRTREAIRDSHVMALQAEPPAAVSALLMQEAARRAPARPRDREARVGFFARFVALMRHPAMAAATVIVLVASIGGVLYMKGKTSAEDRSEAPATPPALEHGVASDQPVAQPVQAPMAGSAIAAGSGSAAAPQPEPVDNQLDSHTVTLADKEGDATRQNEGAQRAQERGRRDGKSASTSGGKAKKDPAAKPGYVEVRTPELQLKGEGADGRAATGSTNYRAGESGLTSAGDSPTNAATTPSKKAAPGTVKPSPPPTAPAATAEAEKRNLAAAQQMHRDLVRAVKANDCKRASQIGASLVERYPDYYAEHVRDDREVKACRPYIDGEVRKRNEQQQKSRAKNSQYDMESPSPSTNAQ